MRITLPIRPLVILPLVTALLLQMTLLAQTKKSLGSAQIKRGEYLVRTSGCTDCHSPKVMGPKGPVPHPMKLLSGAPADTKVPNVPQGVVGPDKWGALTTNDMTTWAGPWGVSFAANLTPDAATGIGGWTEEMFIKSLRTGKHLGTGREILPPMPWDAYGKMTDQDLKDIFAYLKSLKPIANVVPQPIPPGGKGN
jgi:cytochrome c553